VDQLERGQLAQESVGSLTDLGKAIDQAARELATDYRSKLERSFGRLGETVDPRCDDILDRLGNGDLADGSGQLIRVPTRRSAPLLLQRLTSSST
jgi:hypothetical protein